MFNCSILGALLASSLLAGMVHSGPRIHRQEGHIATNSGEVYPKDPMASLSCRGDGGSQVMRRRSESICTMQGRPKTGRAKSGSEKRTRSAHAEEVFRKDLEAHA